MLVKILGAIDMLTGLFFFIFLKSDLFQSFLIFLLVLLVLKALLTIKDLFSIIDIFSSMVIIFALFGIVSGVVWIISGWLFFKGLFSLISSV